MQTRTLFYCGADWRSMHVGRHPIAFDTLVCFAEMAPHAIVVGLPFCSANCQTTGVGAWADGFCRLAQSAPEVSVFFTVCRRIRLSGTEMLSTLGVFPIKFLDLDLYNPRQREVASLLLYAGSMIIRCIEDLPKMKTSFARIVRNFSIAIALATVAPYASVASAEAVTCNKDTNVAAANGLHLSDVTFGTSSSDDCWGVGPQNGQSESANPWYGGSWTPLVSDVGSNDTGYVGDSTNGMEFTLSRGASEWLLSWNDVGQLNALLTMDLVVVLAVKDHYASYLFSAEDFGGSSQRNGTFALRFSTAPLDHFAIYRPTTVALDARLAPQAIPEPAMLTLMGAGLIGLAVSRRRSRKST